MAFGILFDVRDDRRRGRFGSVQTESAGRALVSLHRFQNVLLALFAEARKVAELSFARKLFHVGYRGGLEVGP